MWNFAVMGLGGISHRVIKGIQYAKDASLYAVASRDEAKAKQIKEQYGAVCSYGSYEEMLLDEQVQVVYICTPNYLHAKHIQMCLDHHKHVICEKPLVSNADQLKACFAYARKQGCFLMEAEKTIFTPLNQKIHKMISDGIIGKVRYIEGSYGYYLPVDDLADNYWGFRKEDGGCLYDVGVYPICYANYFAGGNIKEISLHTTKNAKDVVDLAQALITYDNQVIASVRSSWNMDMENYGVIYGDKGYIKTEKFWKNTKAELVQGDYHKTIEVRMLSDFTGEIEHVCECLNQGLLESSVMGEEASMEIMKVLEKQHV